MTKKIDLTKYKEFVGELLSKESQDLDVFIERIKTLKDRGVNAPMLLTASIGMAAEAGEFAELPKKIVFQGKEMDATTRFHMKRELGDILFYLTVAAMALDYDLDELFAENVTKLEARYPGGVFDVFYSENRQEGDL